MSDGGATDASADAGDASDCECTPPPVVFSVDGSARPSEHVHLSASATQFIGGIDRWVLSFTWLHDDPATDDEEEQRSRTSRAGRTR